MGIPPAKSTGYDLTNLLFTQLGIQLIQVIEKALESHDVIECIAGTDIGMNTIWSNAIRHCRDRYGKKRIIFSTYETYQQASSKWTNHSLSLSKSVNGGADHSFKYCIGDGKEYQSAPNNYYQGFINKSDMIIYFLDTTLTDQTSDSHTYNLYNYAVEKGKSIVTITMPTK